MSTTSANEKDQLQYDQWRHEAREKNRILDYWKRAGTSTRVANALANAGVGSIEELRQKGTEWFLTTPNVGRKSLAEMKQIANLPDLIQTSRVSHIATHLLVDELRCRGWTVNAPRQNLIGASAGNRLL